MTKKGILIVISLCITAWVYWNGLSEAFLRWGKQEEYSHGYLIPLVSLYILWEKRGLILSAASQPLWSGVTSYRRSQCSLSVNSIFIYLSSHWFIVSYNW